MNVSPDRLLEEIGRLHIANAVLTEQLANANRVLMQQAKQLEDNSPDEPGEDIPD